MGGNRAAAILILLISGGPVLADGMQLSSGRYAIDFSLELPHLERYAVTRSTTRCVDLSTLVDGAPLPVLSGNKVFEQCSVENVRQGAGKLAYDIVCKGRAAARAVATYDLKPDRFRGRVAMVLGAKNMTMTEVQTGRRLGQCIPAIN